MFSTRDPGLNRMAPLSEEIYQVQINDIFEGPMDLLVHLIKKNEVDIYDIPIALITDQYLEYMELIKALSINLTGDFLVMAATLTHVKSRMLLPKHDYEEEEEDPRMEITKPLIEYLEMKSAAELLAQKDLLGERVFTRAPVKEKYFAAPENEMLSVGIFELIDAFQKILENLSPAQTMDLTVDRISVTERISQIVDLLEERSSMTFVELFADNADKHEIIVTFLAILEMVKLNIIRVVQHVQTGALRLFYQ